MSQSQNEIQQGGAGVPAGAATDAVEFFVPYKNGYAVAAYYLGIFAFIPGIGIFLGVPAFFLGLKGRKIAKQHPQARGKVHAWVGIIMGGLFGIGQLLLLICVLLGFFVFSQARR
jgi:hypothetical protein